MSIFGDFLTRWANCVLYDNLNGAETYIQRWEEEAYKNMPQLNTISQNENTNISERSSDQKTTEPPEVYNHVDQPNSLKIDDGTISDKTKTEKELTNRVSGKLCEISLHNIQENIRDGELLQASYFCAEKGNLKVKKVGKDYIEFFHEREFNLLWESKWLTELFRLRALIDERFSVNVQTNWDDSVAILIMSPKDG